MKNFLKTLIFPIAVIIMLGGFASTAFAVDPTPLVVVFSPTRLFDEPNFLPMDETSGVVTITNNSGETQPIATEAINVFDNDNFGSLLHLKIEGSSGTLFDNSLSNFFSTAGEVSLGILPAGQSKTFTYTISFINSSDNSYQGKTLGFDVCVGFQGGQTHCGDTAVGGEEDTGGTGGDPGGGTLPGTGGGGGGVGGGGGPLTQTLIIWNEQSSGITAGTNPLPIATALITWNTNLLATSQVVYGLKITPTYAFNINTPPAFGYPFYTPEDSTKVLLHSVLLTGLTPGQTYVYRVVSRASPPTISYEHEFTVPLLAQGGSNTFTTSGTGGTGVAGAGNTDSGQGNVLGADILALDSEKEVSSTTGVMGVLNNNLAAAFSFGFGSILSVCSLIALLILLLIYLIWKLWLRGKYEKDGVPEEEIKTRFFIFFGSATALAIVVFFIFGQYCPIPVFLVALIVCLCAYLYKIMTRVV